LGTPAAVPLVVINMGGAGLGLLTDPLGLPAFFDDEDEEEDAEVVAAFGLGLALTCSFVGELVVVLARFGLGASASAFFLSFPRLEPSGILMMFEY